MPESSWPVLRVHASQHGSPTASIQIEVNISNIAGGVAESFLVDWKPNGSSIIRPVLSIPLESIDPQQQVVTTRLLVAHEPVSTSETMHLLLPPSEMNWVNAAASDVTISASSLTSASVSVTVENHGQAPLFYVLVTSSFAGRFSRNLITVPAQSTQTMDFLFASGTALPDTVEQFVNSLHTDWLNRRQQLPPTDGPTWTSV